MVEMSLTFSPPPGWRRPLRSVTPPGKISKTSKPAQAKSPIAKTPSAAKQQRDRAQLEKLSLAVSKGLSKEHGSRLYRTLLDRTDEEVRMCEYRYFEALSEDGPWAIHDACVMGAAPSVTNFGYLENKNAAFATSTLYNTVVAFNPLWCFNQTIGAGVGGVISTAGPTELGCACIVYQPLATGPSASIALRGNPLFTYNVLGGSGGLDITNVQNFPRIGTINSLVNTLPAGNSATAFYPSTYSGSISSWRVVSASIRLVNETGLMDVQTLEYGCQSPDHSPLFAASAGLGGVAINCSSFSGFQESLKCPRAPDAVHQINWIPRHAEQFDLIAVTATSSTSTEYDFSKNFPEHCNPFCVYPTCNYDTGAGVYTYASHSAGQQIGFVLPPTTVAQSYSISYVINYEYATSVGGNSGSTAAALRPPGTHESARVAHAVKRHGFSNFVKSAGKIIANVVHGAEKAMPYVKSAIEVGQTVSKMLMI